MKLFPILLSAALLGGATLVAAPAAQAQVNINTAPPVVTGAPTNAQYYYVPEINGYYDVPARRYLVQRNGKWTRLERMEGYNPANFHPRYIKYRGDSPWTYDGPGNPYRIPPGQAKKMYRRDDDRRGDDDRNDDRRGNHGNGKGHDKEKEKD